MAKIVKIEALLAGSADRFLTDTQLLPDPALVAQGWERRFTTDEQRAREAMELYSQLGYEVRAEPVSSENFHDDCQDCRDPVSFSLRTIYTRRKSKE